MVKAYCIAGISTTNKYYDYWTKVEDFTLPEEVAKVFNYKK